MVADRRKNFIVFKGEWRGVSGEGGIPRIRRFERSLNASFVTIVPKKEVVTSIKDFRPISLVGNIYKIISKVIINRLKKVLDEMVSTSQNAFVEGSQILNAALVANEAVDSRKKKGVPGILCMLDLEKAYDHVNWHFLDFIMSMMGVGNK